MATKVYRYPDVGVSQAFLHDLGIHPGAEQEAGVEVAQVMEPHPVEPLTVDRAANGVRSGKMDFGRSDPLGVDFSALFARGYAESEFSLTDLGA